MAPFGVQLWENAFQTIPDISFFDAPKTCSAIFFSKKNRIVFFFQENCALEELWFFGRDVQMRLDKWSPKFWLSALYDFSQRGQSGTYHFWSGFWTEKDFNHLVLWCYDHMIWWYYDSLLSWSYDITNYIRTAKELQGFQKVTYDKNCSLQFLSRRYFMQFLCYVTYFMIWGFRANLLSEQQ